MQHHLQSGHLRSHARRNGPRPERHPHRRGRGHVRRRLGRVSGDLVKIFGEDRVRDTPISEAAIVGAGLGAAMMGLRPIVEIMFGDFLPVAGDQLVNQLAKARYMSGGKANVPVTVRVTTGAPGSSAAQHSQSPEGWYMNVPGLKIAVPATPADAKGLLKTALRGRGPGALLRAQDAVRDEGRGAGRSRLRGAVRPGRSAPGGQGRDHHRHRRDAAEGAGSRRRCWPEKGSRSRSSTRARWCRWTRRRSSPRCARPAGSSSPTRRTSGWVRAQRSPR